MVHFTRWEPGGEHIKQLVVKNVVMKTQKIKYKLPQTRYFSMDFPETQTLSAGMSWTVPITFRPECYSDVIEFTTSFGKFYLPVKATLPEHVLEFPETVDFSLCPVRETAKKTFVLRNTGELVSCFEWEISKPFSISPKSGSLPPGGCCVVTVEFKPMDASVFTSVAVCLFGDRAQWDKAKVTQAMTVYGIGKYSHLRIEGNPKVFDFGEVFIGKSVEKKFVLENHSVVHANFKIKRSERDTDPYFEFSMLSGTVPSKKSIEIGITYTPVAAGMYSNDYFDITTLSGNTLRISCRGCGVGPKVTLNPDIVNFHDTQAGSTITRALYLQNHTSTPAFYQFLTEVNSTFRIDKPWGTINPNSSVALTVKFSPVEPINYHRRVYCLVEHQDAIFVDFMGTCYNDKRRPATFKPQHIFNYQERVKNGLWQYGPEQLEEMLKTSTVVCNKGVLMYSDQELAAHQSMRRILDSPYDDGLVGSEYFYENAGEMLACTLNDTYVDFGACSRYRVIESQTIRITNNTKGKMSCVWILPGESSGDEPVFTVTPKVADILAKGTMEFRVNFRPKVDNSFYGAQLECFVYFKSMRNFRLVNEDTFTPPWCLTPTIAGNTFPPGEDTFIPKISFGATRLDFPACHVDKSVYRTVRVSNSGDTSVKFSFLDSGVRSTMGIGGGTELASRGGATFSVKPRIGILHKGESRLIVFRFSPSEQREYEQALKCYFNSSLNNSYDLQMRGIGYYPQISFEDNNTLCFKPTCIGAVAVRHFTIRNTSRISVNFEWRIPRQYASVVSIEPLCDILAPNSVSVLTCTFAPNNTSNFILKIPCYYSHELLYENETVARRRASFVVMGRGMLGNVIAKPSIVEFETILVNTAMEREIVLFNPSECDVFYTLEIYRKNPEDNQLFPLPNNIKESELEITQLVKALPARSNQTLKIKACVRNQSRYEFSVFYRIDAHAIAAAEGVVVPSSLRTFADVPRYHLFDVTATGVHPMVKATDIQCQGFSKTVLWQLFSLDKFNEILAEAKADPFAYADQALDDDTFPIESPQVHMSTSEAELLFDFGATSVGCKPTVFNLKLFNAGVVPVDWVFHFPNDLEVEIEHWADPGDYTEEQLHHNLILDNNIFCVTPKSGSLRQGESVQVLMSYSHEFAGLHMLPVVFKLRNGASRSGKEIMISFTGYSVPPGKKYLHLQSASHSLHPISIGVHNPPVQTYRLMNRGSVSLEYYIDTSSLERLKQENHNFDILSCLRSSGTIPPGGMDYIEWIFHPLEEKQYEVDIPISVVSGRTRIVTIKGQGLQSLDSHPGVRHELPRTMPLTIPASDNIDASDQISALSLETISFGNVPLGAVVRQVVVITNTSKSVDASFKWTVPSFWPAGTIKVLPSQGRLSPGQSRICKVIFTPKDTPRIFDFDLVCEVLNETEMDNYTAQHEMIERARREGRQMSIPEPSSASPRERTGPKEAQQQQPRQSLHRSSRLQPPSANQGVDISKLKYRPLPGITPPPPGNKTPEPTKGAAVGVPTATSGATAAAAAEEVLHVDKTRPSRPVSTRSGASDSTFVELPSPPVAFQMFLSVKATTYTVEEFRKLFGGYDTFFQDHNVNHASHLNDSGSVPTLNGFKAIQTMMLSLLNEIFQDPDLHAVPQNTLKQPLPYFAQIAKDTNRHGILLEHIDDARDAADVEHNNGSCAMTIAPSEASIIGSFEFQSAVESVLEGTVFNLIQEANAGEFDWSKYPILFADAKSAANA
ncbi:hypothetical protein BC831DRAFT_417141 [Entophlyctis helioformis]|nr:hypothetical protein BC831DRAFT_417141 [Entophlyctis helioformis]